MCSWHISFFFAKFYSILNIGVKWPNLNLQAVYNKMTKFQDPNELRKEMVYYTYDEFN